MKSWLQYLCAAGILAIILASTAYTWQQIESYLLRREVDHFCRSAAEKYSKDEAERWIMKRNCINKALAREKSDDLSSDIADLKDRIEDVSHELEAQYANLQSQILNLEAEAVRR